MTQLRCLVVRGLPKEAEEELNKFLSSNLVRIDFVVQSESGNHITITLIYEPIAPIG